MQGRFDFAQEPSVARLEPLRAGDRRIVFGTCGFSYADWVGRFYPPGMRARDMLAYYARRFSAVEIDSSYYGVPSRATCERFVARTPNDFRFTLKVPGTLTHVPPQLRAELHPDAAALLASLQPLRESGKLTALVMQFPNSFRCEPAAYEHLARLRDAFADVALVAEFRHREWQQAATLHLLDELRIGWINVDQPQFETLLRPSSDVVGPLAYVRFHGRNYRQWWNPPTSADRYTYSYEPQELEPWADRILEMAERAYETLVFFNNHQFAHATVDAVKLATLLRVRLSA